MKKTISRIGLLGGGQLARMMALRGHELGFEIFVLSESQLDPAAQVVGRHTVGSVNDLEAVTHFLGHVDVATFESEFLDADLLEQAVRRSGISVSPFPALMGKLQDRLSQKQLLKEEGIRSAPFLPVRSPSEAEDFLAKYPDGLVLKQRRFGYDGYGTFKVRSTEDLAHVEAKMANYRHGFIAEPVIKFKRELAITLVRDHEDEILQFPLVESFQKDSRCYWVKGPIRHSGSGRLIAKLKSFLRSLNYQGAMAFELFDTRDGLMVNELAPRVHNSCHYSLDALSIDQFSAHLLAISGRTLPKIQALSRGFAMVNLLGGSGQTPFLATPSFARLHWYGKTENRPGRKMGHLNALAESPEKALKAALKAEREFRI